MSVNHVLNMKKSTKRTFKSKRKKKDVKQINKQTNKQTKQSELAWLQIVKKKKIDKINQ